MAKSLLRTAKIVFYRVRHGFRLINRDDYFRVDFDHFLSFFVSLWAVEKIGLSLSKFNQVKLVQIRDKQYIINSKFINQSEKVYQRPILL